MGIVKDIVNATALALLLSASVVAVFAHVWLGTGSFFTAAYLVMTTMFLVVFGRWRSFVLADLLWLCLCGFFGLSAIQHPPVVSEAALFALALAAYPASRGLPGTMQNPAFLTVLGILVALGSVLTLLAFNTEASRLHGRPLIFGQYDHPLIVFALLLSLLIFAAACSSVKLKLVTPIFVVPIAILAAAQVRFIFLALLIVLVSGAMISPSERRRFAVIGCLVVFAVVVGAFCKLDSTIVYTKYAAESIQSFKDREPPTFGCERVNFNNSVDIRRQVYKEALALLPEAGITGIGVGRFAERSCASSQVHNTILQAAVELGTPASLVLVGLIVVVWSRLFQIARQGPQTLFALCVLTFAILLSLVYGTLGSASFLFVALGYGVAVSSIRQISQLGRASDLAEGPGVANAQSCATARPARLKVDRLASR